MSKIRYILFFSTFVIFLSSCSKYNRLLKSNDYEKKFEVAEKYYKQEDFYKAQQLLEDLLTYFRGTEKAEKVSSTADALAFCKRHFARLAQEGAKEEFHVVLLDQKHHVIKTEQITVGLSNQSLAHPREVFRPAIQESASAVILVHNHPSGDPTPSQEDKTITKELKGAAEILRVRLLDHIILGKDRALSMAEEKIF